MIAGLFSNTFQWWFRVKNIEKTKKKKRDLLRTSCTKKYSSILGEDIGIGRFTFLKSLWSKKKKKLDKTNSFATGIYFLICDYYVRQNALAYQIALG